MNKLNKQAIILSSDELMEYNSALKKLDEAETMLEVNAWKRKIDSIIEKASPYQEERRKKGNVVPIKPIVKLTEEELLEYNEALDKLNSAETMREVDAWKKKIYLILDKSHQSK